MTSSARRSASALRIAHTPRHTHEFVRAQGLGVQALQDADAAAASAPTETAATAPTEAAAATPAEAGAATNRGRLVRASAVMASGSIISRILGLVRNWLFGAVLAGNATVAANAFSAANTVPNTVWILVGGGTLNAILVPAIVRATRQPDRGSDYISRLMTLVAVAALGLTVVSMAAVPLLIPLTSGVLPPETFGLAVQLGLWMMPQIFFMALYVMCGQLLNAHESFGPYQFAPVMNNLVGIIGAVIFLMVWGPTGAASNWTIPMIITMAMINLGGSVAQVVFLLWYVRGLGLKLRPRWGFRGLGFGRLGKIGLWTLAMMGLGQLGIWATRWAVGDAARAAERYADQPEVAARYPGLLTLDWAYLAFMIPQGIIAVTLVTAVFPTIARRASAGDHRQALASYAETNRMLAIPMVLCAVVFAVLAAPIMWVIGGGTDPLGAGYNAWVLVAYMIGLVPFSATYLVKRVFYAYEDARTPFLMQIPVAVVPVLAALPILRLVDPQWATATAAGMSSLGYIAGWVMGLVLLRRRALALGVPPEGGTRTLVTLGKLLVAGAFAAVFGLAGLWVLDDLIWTHRLVAVAAGTVLGAVMTGVFLAAAWLLRVEELRMLAGALRRRRG